MPGQVKCALYARVSKADDSQDPENQLMRLRTYAKDRGWGIFAEYVDMASGADVNRPRLKQMLTDAAARRFGLVICVKIDRIARSSLHLKQVIADLEGRGIKFECVDQAFSTNTPSGRLLFGVLGEIAEFERGLIIERTKAGLARARAQGVTLGRPRKALDMQLARDMRAQGLGYRKIAKALGVSYVTARERLIKEGAGAPNDSDSETRA